MAEPASTLVALATFNEIENLPTLVDAIHAELPEAHVLVVDDNSPDGTGTWCAEFTQQHTWFFHLPRAGKLGLGTALAAALQFAVEKKYTQVITLDADWSHPPSSLPALVAAAASADVVIGSRYCPGGGIEGWPLRRKIASRTINMLARTMIGLPLSDCSGNYRLYRTELLAQLQWENLHASGYAYLEEILWHLQQLEANFAEVPIVFSERRAGQSKINLGEMLGAAKTLTRLTLRRLRGNQLL
ncbi:MAG: polyprenol monophosphomannose synthase [Planctomycetes bacterium]|nr:polyprenol monophosphomannose synthase [Planctomycetota bacterium]